MADKYDLSYMALAKLLGLYSTRRGRSYKAPVNMSKEGFLNAGLARYYDLNPHRPAGLMP